MVAMVLGVTEVIGGVDVDGIDGVLALGVTEVIGGVDVDGVDGVLVLGVTEVIGGVDVVGIDGVLVLGVTEVIGGVYVVGIDGVMEVVLSETLTVDVAVVVFVKGKVLVVIEGIVCMEAVGLDVVVPAVVYQFGSVVFKIVSQQIQKIIK